MRELIVSNKQLPSIKEGIVKGLEVASGAKSSSTYYHKREDQIAAIRGSIDTLYAIGKELPLLLAAQRGVTGFFIQETLLNEFKNGERGGACNIVNPQTWYDENMGSKVTEHLLYVLDRYHGIPYVLRLFDAFKEHKINNQRSRKMALRFIFSHPNLEYVSVKYRNKLRSSLTHIYGEKKLSALIAISRKYIEQNMFDSAASATSLRKNLTRFAVDSDKAVRMFMFIMGEGYKEYYNAVDYPVVSQFYKAKSDITGCDKLPAEVVEGLISDKNHPQYRELWSTEAKRKRTQKMIKETVQTTTANQAMRQTKKNEELGVTKKADVAKVTDFLALYKTGYEAGFTPALREAIDSLADKRKFTNFMYQNIGVIVDKSASMTGHKVESKNTPRAIASFTAEVLNKSADRCSIVATHAGAGSDLATSFLDLVSNGEFEAVFIISDGYENTYDGLLNEVVEAWRSAEESVMPIYHVSPITGSEVGAKVRSFGAQISTIAVNRPDGLLLQLTNKLLEQDIKAWLAGQVRMLESVELPKNTKKVLEGAN